MKTELKLAWRYLCVRRVRTLLTTLSILLGVMLIFGLNSLMPAFMETFNRNLLAMSGHVDLTLASSSGGTFRMALLDPLREVDGVDGISVILRRSVVVPDSLRMTDAKGAPIAGLTISGVEPGSYDSFHLPKTDDGVWLTEDADGSGVVLSAPLARSMGLKPGDGLILPSATGSETFRVIGIMQDNPSASKDELWVSLAAAQRLFGTPEQGQLAEFRFKTGADAKAVAQAVLDKAGNSFATGGIESGAEFKSVLDLGNKIFLSFGLIALLMGAFIIFVTFRTMVAEHRRDIGLLRAIGMSRGGVVRVILYEGLIQGAIGSVVGVIAGLAMTYGMIAALSGLWQDFTHQSVGSPPFNPGLIIGSLALGMLTALAGGCLPALGAARISPMDALRPAEPMGTSVTRRRTVFGLLLLALAVATLPTGNMSLIAFGFLLFFIGLGVAGPILVTPISRMFSKPLQWLFSSENELAQGNLSRNPRRASATMMTVGIGMALLVAIFGVVTSLMSAMEEYIGKSLGSDFIIYPQSIILNTGNMGAGPELLDGTGKTEGISEATAIKVVSAKTEGSGGTTGIQVIGVDPVNYPKLSGLTFSQGDSTDWGSLSSGEVIINGILSGSTGLKRGDSINLTTSTGVRAYRIAAVGVDFLNAKISTAYMGLDSFTRDFGKQPDILILANIAPGSDENAVMDSLSKLIAAYPTFTLETVTAYKEKILDDLKTTMSSMYFLLLFLLLPSLIALINTISISVIERTRELGVLRAMGMLRKQLRRMITAESLLLSSLGVLAGIIGGIWLGSVMVWATQSAGFPMTWHFPWTGLACAAVSGVAFALIGARQPAKYAARLDVVKALQYE